jgi:hypothetical protein
MKARTLARTPERKFRLDKLMAFPRLPEMQQVTLKAPRWEERDKRLVIKEAQMVT